MVTLTDRQTAVMVADLEKLLKSATDLRSYTTRKLLLMIKKKQRYELLHNRKDL